jgi:hypothetical protein
MKPVIITPRNKKEFDFVAELLGKLNISTRTLSQEELEDIGMSKLMREADRHKKVSREQVMKKLISR